jgi:hypothetical protein
VDRPIVDLPDGKVNESRQGDNLTKRRFEGHPAGVVVVLLLTLVHAILAAFVELLAERGGGAG